MRMKPIIGAVGASVLAATGILRLRKRRAR